MDIFTVYMGSEGQTVSQQIKQDGRPFDLTTSSVRFYMRYALSDDLKITDEPANVEDAGSGLVSFEWTNDLDEQGEYFGWWKVIQPDTSEIDSDEFLIVVTEHAPGIRTRTGTIYDFCRSFIPSTWNALERDEQYGDALLQRRIEVQKLRLFGITILPEDEEDLDIRVQSFLAKLTVLNLMSTAMEYWMNQRESVNATGTSEASTWPERIEHLKQIRDQLTREVLDERDEIEEIVDLPPALGANSVPEFTPGTEDGFVTPLPSEEHFSYAFPDRDPTLW